MVPWLVFLELLAFHAICALPWGIPATRNTFRPLSRLCYANDQKPVTEQHQEKTSRPFWGDIFDKVRKAVTTPEVKDVTKTAKEEIDRVADKVRKAVTTQEAKDVAATAKEEIDRVTREHFPPSLQQILRDMTIRADKDIKTVGNFFRGENEGVEADKVVRVVYRGDKEKERAEKKVS